MEAQAWTQMRCHLIAVLLFSVAICVQADQRVTSQGKLEAARKYADEFLKQDARPGQQFFLREPKFPLQKDQPVTDCAMHAIIRAIQTREPYFEDRRQSVVVVPVWVELLALNVSEDEGYPFGRSEGGVVQCGFEYELYSFRSKRFERIPALRNKPFIETFRTWGELTPRSEALRGGNARDIAIDVDKRYARFKFRVSVRGSTPYQLYPQFPRHHPVEASLESYKSVLGKQAKRLELGVSDRNPRATGKELVDDLADTRRQLFENEWIVGKIRQLVTEISSTPSFSDLELQ